MTTARLPREICAMIYEFAYEEEAPSTFCTDIACWNEPACVKCNDELWARQFYIKDIEEREKQDDNERRLIIASSKEVLQQIGDDESLSDFLEKWGHEELVWSDDDYYYEEEEYSSDDEADRYDYDSCCDDSSDYY